jgi:D-serine deaminase-like pyridoxal phosphate-dependent protein
MTNPLKPAPEWYEVANIGEVDSPALLVYPGRVEENLRRMITMAGGAHRLCTHVKTHKLPELVRLQLSMGITKFKCATIAEAEMAAANGAPDVLLAYQPVGPKVRRIIELARRFPDTKFSTITDNEAVVRTLSEAAVQAGIILPVLVDIDCGMHRSGIGPDAGAFELFQLIASSPGLAAGGLHVYDGHLHQPKRADREAAHSASIAPVKILRERLLAAGLPVPRVVAGGTPSFPMHARDTTLECSPGTCVFWDSMSQAQCSDLDFLPAALVLTRVVSKIGGNRLCLDLGHKAIASENPHPRVIFLNLPDAVAVMHSEEHLVVETARAGDFPIGATLYGVPWHICPTVALYAEAVVVKEGVAADKWTVEARSRFLHV